MSLIDQLLNSNEPKSLWKPIYEAWDEALHAEAVDALAGADDARLVAYLEAVASVQRYRRSFQDLRPLTWPMLRDRPLHGEGPATTRLAIWKLQALDDLGAREEALACLAELPPALVEKLPPELVSRVEASTPEAMAEIGARVSAGEEVEAEAFRRYAASRLRVFGLKLILGVPGRGPVLLADGEGRAHWFDGEAFSQPEIDLLRRPGSYEFLAPSTPMSERRLYVSGKHAHAFAQRYGRVVLLREAVYVAARGQAETALDVLLRFPTEAWAESAVEGFEAALPKALKRVDDFTGKGVIYVREYKDPRALKNSEVPRHADIYDSRGAQGECLVTAGASPGVVGLEMRRDETERLWVTDRLEDEARARAAFEAEELERLLEGQRIEKIHILPLREPEEAAEDVVKRAHPELAETIERLEELLEEADSFEPVDELVLAANDEALDRWGLAGISREVSSYRFEDQLGDHLGDEWATIYPVRTGAKYLQGEVLGSTTVGRRALPVLLERSGHLDEAQAIVRGLHTVVVPDRRGAGPINLSAFSAYLELETLIVDGRWYDRSTHQSGQNPIVELQSLAGLPRLRRVVLSHVEAVDLSPLSGCAALEVLELNATTATGLGALASSGLRTLCLREASVDELGPLPPTLRELVVKGDFESARPPKGLSFHGLSRLEALTLETPRLELEGLESCARLTRCDLQGCDWVDDGTVDRLASLPSLAAVGLAGTAATPSGALERLGWAACFAPGTDLALTVAARSRPPEHPPGPGHVSG